MDELDPSLKVTLDPGDPSPVLIELRKRAEALAKKKDQVATDADITSPEEVRRLFHDLEVHQIELEMQNEELRQAQLVLAAIRARYFDLYEFAPIGYITLSTQGLIQQANLSAASMLEIPRGELISKPISRFIFPDDQDIFYFARKRLSLIGVFETCDLRIVKATGDFVWVHLTAALAHCDEGGNELRLVLTDISARKQAELEILNLNAALDQRVRDRTEELEILNATLTKFKAALDEHALVTITDASGKITYANEKFCATSKYTKEELIGQNHHLVNSGHHSNEFFKELWETIVAGQVWKGEIRNRTKDGTLFWVNTTIVPFLDQEGKPFQHIAIRTDITNRKNAEAALLESEECVRLAVETANIGVWELDLETQQVKWETNMFKIYGSEPSPDGIISYKGWSDAVLASELSAQEAQLAQVIATGVRGNREFHITRASDGKVRTIQASEMAIKGLDGKVTRLLGINMDITERKEAEGKIQKLNDDLLRRADELEYANKELEAFSYSVSHDLRAPLRAIDGFSRMLAEDCAEKLVAEDKRKLEIIRSEAQRMGKLIDDLLLFSRLGRQNLEPSVIEMQAMAQEVFDELMTAEPERQVHLELHALPPATGSQAMIRQVWTNLISNGIKFTKHREVSKIEIGIIENATDGCIYYVKDNGAGFDKRYADKLFGVFQRLHSQLEFQGTGVGLALAQRIVQRHGGRIWADAEVDHGATFYFTLPNPMLRELTSR